MIDRGIVGFKYHGYCRIIRFISNMQWISMFVISIFCPFSPFKINLFTKNTNSIVNCHIKFITIWVFNSCIWPHIIATIGL